MIKHEFYAEPTVFDNWQIRAEDWLCARLGKLCPYLWSLAFLAAAMTCCLVAVATLLSLLAQTLGGENALSSNQFLAQALTIVISLIAFSGLLAQASKAWPMARRPAWFARMVAASAPATQSARPAPAVNQSAVVRSSATAVGREIIQNFFIEVRAAGVNVAIARSLFAGGIRSAGQLRAAPDRELLQICGVGPATLHRLRAHFGTCSASAAH